MWNGLAHCLSILLTLNQSLNIVTALYTWHHLRWVRLLCHHCCLDSLTLQCGSVVHVKYHIPFYGCTISFKYCPSLDRIQIFPFAVIINNTWLMRYDFVETCVHLSRKNDHKVVCNVLLSHLSLNITARLPK